MGLISRVSSRTYRNAMKLISSICIAGLLGFGDVSAGRSRLEPAPEGGRLVRLLFENTREEGRLNVYKFRMYRQQNKGRKGKYCRISNTTLELFNPVARAPLGTASKLSGEILIATTGLRGTGELYLGALLEPLGKSDSLTIKVEYDTSTLAGRARQYARPQICADYNIGPLHLPRRHNQ